MARVILTPHLLVKLNSEPFKGIAEGFHIVGDVGL